MIYINLLLLKKIHNYIRDLIIKQDYINKDIKNIKLHLSDNIYLRKFLVEYLYDMINKGYNKSQLLDLFIKKYGEIKIDYNNISEEFKKKIL